MVSRGVGRVVRNGCTLGPKSYPSSLCFNLHLAGPRIHGQTGLAQSNTGSDTCVQYALPDQGPKVAGSWSRMARYLGRAMLTWSDLLDRNFHILIMDEKVLVLGEKWLSKFALTLNLPVPAKLAVFKLVKFTHI